MESADRSSEEPRVGNVPDWMWFDGGARDGGTGKKSLLLWVQGAMFNSSAASVDEYVLATTRVLDSALDRASDDKVEVFVDTAAYRGMNNEPASHIVRFASAVASTLNRHYPGRFVSTQDVHIRRESHSS